MPFARIVTVPPPVVAQVKTPGPHPAPTRPVTAIGLPSGSRSLASTPLAGVASSTCGVAAGPVPTRSSVFPNVSHVSGPPIGALFTAVTVIVLVARLLGLVPSLTLQVTVRGAVDGLPELLK